MKTVGLDNHDNFFKGCSSILEKCEKIRSGLGDSVDNMHELAKLYKLVDGKLNHCVEGWIWAIYSNKKGADFDL